MSNSMLPIPYARQRPYEDDGYVTRMSDLMLEASRAQQVALRQTGAAAAGRWTGAGNVIAGTLADVAKQRDYRRQLALREQERAQERADMLAQRGADNAFREKSHAEQVAARDEDRKFRESQFRDSRASAAADDVAPFEDISPEEYQQRYAGTVAAPRFRHGAAQDERLPASPMMDMGGIPGFATPETDEQPWLAPVAPSMSDDIAARPERYTRTPNGQERLAISNAESQERARVLAEQNRVRDDKRTAERDIANSNHQAKLLAVTEARLNLARQQAQGNGDLTPKQVGYMFQMSNGLKSHPAYADMLDIDSAFKSTQIGLSQQNGFGDVTAINGFQRMVDPGVSVREGDVALLQSASAMVDKILSDYPLERLKNGSKLPDAVRERMAKTARELHAARARAYNETVGNQYRQQAEAVGVPFNLIGVDFLVGPATPERVTPAGGGKPKVTRDKNGNLIKAGGK